MKRVLCMLLALALGILSGMEVYAAQGMDDASQTGPSAEEEAGNGTEASGENPGEDTPAAEKAIRVLIVGNSFSKRKSQGVTYSVGKILESLAVGEGRSLYVKTLAHGSAFLSYYAGMDSAHYSYHRELEGLLSEEEWDYIVFQEQTKAPIEYLEERTYPAVEWLLKMVKQYQPQATPLLYMTQGYSDGVPIKVNGDLRILTSGEMELYLAAGYHILENKLGVEVVPAGMHANRAHILYPWMRLTAADEKHPAYAGYYLAACAFYYRIFREAPDPRKASLKNSSLTERDLMLLASLVPDSIRMDQKNVFVGVNGSAKVTAITSGYSAVTYKCMDTEIASVNPATGVVRGKKGGTTVVAAVTPDGLQAFCTVTVRIPPSFSRDWYLAGKGDRIQILPLTNVEDLTWESSKPSVAYVDKDTGIVVVKSSGKAVITAADKNNAEEQASYTLYVAYDKPEGLKASSSNKYLENTSLGNVKLTWQPVDGASSYRIYRSEKKNGKYKLIGTAKKTSYVDKKAKVDTCYYYKVAVGNAYKQCQNPFSGSARGIALKAPSLNVKRLKKGYAKLTWKRNMKAAGYIIYASSKKNSGYKEIASITSRFKVSYTDKSLRKGQSRYYRIRAYKILDGETYYGVRSKSVKVR